MNITWKSLGKDLKDVIAARKIELCESLILNAKYEHQKKKFKENQ